MKNEITKVLTSRRMLHIAGVYLASALIILRLIEQLSKMFDLPATVGQFAAVLLIAGLPATIALMWGQEPLLSVDEDGVEPVRPAQSEVFDEDGNLKLSARLKARLVDFALGVFVAVVVIAVIAEQLISSRIEDELGADLDRSIAVLPFVNMSADPDNAFFSDGLSEELLNLLTKIPELRVTGRTSAFVFRDDSADITEIAAKLNVAHVLKGSVRKSGDKIRVTAQLINAGDGYLLWSESWDRELDDIFLIQDEISAAVVESLRIELLGDMPRAIVTDVRAFELELKSRAAANQFTREGLEEAQALTTEALAIDPSYADAWYDLSIIYSNMVSRDFMAPPDGFPKARLAALRALEIDPDHAGALSSLGWIAMFWERDMDAAARYMQRALRIAPHHPRVLNAYGTLQSAFGRVDETINYYREALAHDPLSVPVLSNTALALMEARRFEEARELIARIQEARPESYLHDRNIAWLKLSEGKLEEAIAGFEKLPGLIGKWGLALSYSALGDIERSDQALEAIRDDPRYTVAVAGVFATRGANDEAFDYLERAVQSNTDALMEIRMYSAFSPIHSDPRWLNLLERLGLSDADAARLDL